MTRIDIISGFLGAGKTTLIKKLLGDALKGQQVVLIENEFGEIGIDGGFLKDAGIEIREMNSGCICCSLVGDFGAALKDVITKYHPDRIIIEPSGVGKLSDVIKAVDGVEKEAGVALNSATTVVDVMKCKMYLRNFGEFFENQVKSAGTIILSRTDKADTEKVEAAVKMLRELNPEAHIITTPVEVLGGKKVLDTMEGAIINLAQVEEEEHHHHHHDHDECCCGHDHDEEHEHHHHDHDEDEHEHHHHDHDGECCCGHDHDEEHEHHHHDHDDECCCGHDHDHEHHHHHDDECGCGHEHHHHHDHEDHDEDEHEHHHHDHEDGETCSCGHHHHHHHGHDADEVFVSVGVETANRYEQDEVKAMLDKLSDEEEYGTVLRAKGVLQNAAGDWFQFDYVPGESQFRPGTPDYTGRLCVIGAHIDEKALRELFKA